MSEEKIVKKQLLKNMLLTFIAFSIIFACFDFIIYNQVYSSIYNSIDKEISEAVDKAKNHDNSVQKDKTPPPDANSANNNESNSTNSSTDTTYNNSNGAAPDNMDNKLDMLDNLSNPRLIYIERDENGNILNQSSIGRFYEDYITSVEFDKTNLDTVYTLTINNTYSYRGENFEIVNQETGEITYVQLLANVDGEMQTVNNTLKTLIMATTVMVMISIIVSYILSRRTLKPIIESWNRQTEFVQNASHELRTPLTIIQAKQELLLQEPNKKIIDKSQDITVCLNETRRLSKLVKELMTLARADSNKLDLNKEQTDIDSLIKEVVQPYIEMASIQNKKVKLNLQYNKNVNIDRNKISQLIIIVLDNAIKYTSDNDEIEISTQLKDGKLLLQVSDTGIGISKESIKHIFDRFYREDKARSRETGGNGLGLSIAQTIVMAHGGNIKIAQNDPKGTKVIIKI